MFPIKVIFKPDKKVGIDVLQFLSESIRIFQLHKSIELVFDNDSLEEDCKVNVQGRIFNISQAGEIVPIFNKEILPEIQNRSLLKVS